MLPPNNIKNNFLNIKKIRNIIINNWKHLKIFVLILEIRKD
jgi:hypothetical protein